MAESFPDHSDARVRAVLQYLCKDPKVAKEVDKAFKILAAHDDDEAQRQAHDGQASLVPSAGNSEAHQSARGGEGEGENAPLVIVKKRKVGDANGPAVADDGAHTGPARIENPAAKICVYCSTAFTAETNHNRACRSHDGTLDVETESNFWYDIFESHPDPNADPHAEADDEEYRQQYPQGYEWSCCGRDGTKRGCKLRAHSAGRAEPLAPDHRLERWSRWYRAGYDERRARQEASLESGVGWDTVESEVRGYLEYRRERDAARQERVRVAGPGGDDDDASELSVGHSDEQDRDDDNDEGDDEDGEDC